MFSVYNYVNECTRARYIERRSDVDFRDPYVIVTLPINELMPSHHAVKEK